MTQGSVTPIASDEGEAASVAPAEASTAAPPRRRPATAARPASALGSGVVSALTITDRSCELVTGLGPRPWRLALVELEVPHTRIGHRTLCAASAWLAAVERAAGAPRHIVTDEECIARASRRGRQ